jgi:hypothetical protein
MSECNSITESQSNGSSWLREKSEAKFYTHRKLAFWPEPEPTLTEWFISALDPDCVKTPTAI